MSTQDSQIHSVHTRFKTNLHPPIANLTKFQKGVYYSGIKNFNNIPHDIKDLANKVTLFWNALKRFLLINSFYNSEEYFNPLNPELNPICYLLALLAHHFLHVSRIRVKSLTCGRSPAEIVGLNPTGGMDICLL